VREGKWPVLVYMHGGFALGEGDVSDCEPFLRAGFGVFAPAFRGENGNPGNFEFAYGELDDARAALMHVREIPEADPKRVVVFGHSAGGMLASLVSLYVEPGVLYTGSAGGLYGPSLFDHYPLPFGPSKMERKVRLFAPYVRHIKQPHWACYGAKDDGTRAVSGAVQRSASGRGLPFSVKEVPGDHFTSLPSCMRSYLDLVLPLVR
jgi:dienelactone hydrolase